MSESEALIAGRYRLVKVIATGGLAALLQDNTDVFDVIEPDLTIQGLAMMWERAHIAA